jgi:hypothetical protein|tara:strand:- start:634 stop:1971 length:1338 start_codon:yes stop_codon:yes gene_type:complete
MAITINERAPTFGEQIQVMTQYNADKGGGTGSSTDAVMIDESGAGLSFTSMTDLWLTNGAKEIINLLPEKLIDICMSDVSFTAGTPNTLNNNKIRNVKRQNSSDELYYKCRRVSPTLKDRYNNSNDINFPTETDPIYFIDNGTIDVLPNSSQTVKYSEINYPTVKYSHTSVSNKVLPFVQGADSGELFTNNDGNPTLGSVTAADHGLSVGDRVLISSVQGDTALEGVVSTVATIPATTTFTLNNVTVGSGGVTLCTITKLGGFPSEAEYLVPIYASINALQYKMNYLIENTDVTTAISAINTALDRIPSELWDDTDIYDGDELVKVKDALDNARTLIDDGANSPTGSASSDAASHLVNEDMELVKSTIDVATAEINRASAHIKEWDTVAATALKEAQGYADEAKNRMSRLTAEYGWFEKQQTKLENDYMMGLHAIGVKLPTKGGR